MARRPVTIERDGAWWFALCYAAKLLGTTERKFGALILTGVMTGRDEAGGLWVAERDVTALRRDPAALKAAKASVREEKTVAASASASPRRRRSKVSMKDVPHTIVPTAPPIVIDPFGNRRAVQQVLPWTTDHPGFAAARPVADEDATV